MNGGGGGGAEERAPFQVGLNRLQSRLRGPEAQGRLIGQGLVSLRGQSVCCKALTLPGVPLPFQAAIVPVQIRIARRRGQSERRFRRGGARGGQLQGGYGRATETKVVHGLAEANLLAR